LRYDYLPPLRLNVASIRVEQRFVPSGVGPDVSRLDPVAPVQVLVAMAEDRLQAMGSTGEAVFVIQDASLVRQGSSIQGTFAVELDIYTAPDTRAGYAEARAARTYNGSTDDMAGVLYDMTKALMDQMNVEFEYQVRRSLRAWLLTASAAPAAVQQQPLAAPGAPTP
jgi:cytochrome c biogenesis protein ResB